MTVTYEVGGSTGGGNLDIDFFVSLSCSPQTSILAFPRLVPVPISGVDGATKKDGLDMEPGANSHRRSWHQTTRRSTRTRATRRAPFRPWHLCLDGSRTASATSMGLGARLCRESGLGFSMVRGGALTGSHAHALQPTLVCGMDSDPVLTPRFNVHGVMHVDDDEQMAPVEREVRNLASGLQMVKDEQSYLVVRERVHRDTCESTVSLYWGKCRY